MTASTLPQLGPRRYLTDGGIETTLIYHQGVTLREFAAFELLRDATGRRELERYYTPYLELARRHAAGFVLESPTWRASTDWGTRLGYDADALRALNREAIGLMRTLAEAHADVPIVVSGCIGPRGDGYVAGKVDAVAEAERHHALQVETFSAAGVDLVSAMTMTSVTEAAGIACAAAHHGLRAAISFTVETDGRLPSGETLAEAIERVDDAAPGTVGYFMINCAHPRHFEATLRAGGAWRERIAGLRANASAKSHAELDASTTLDDGDPRALGRDYLRLREWLPRLNVLGGCCGTDVRHVEEMASSCADGAGRFDAAAAAG